MEEKAYLNPVLDHIVQKRIIGHFDVAPDHRFVQMIKMCQVGRIFRDILQYEQITQTRKKYVTYYVWIR